MKKSKSTFAHTHVMVVDDTPANLLLLETILREIGCKISAFPEGEMALAAALRNPPDLFLLDIMMPGMNGFELAQQLNLNEETRGIPVLFISALNSLDDKMEAFAHGAVDYISKPFQEKEVLARVRTHLDIATMRKALCDRNAWLEEKVAQRTAELMRANEQLRQLSRVKEDFLLMISHELRTPTTGLLLLGEVFMEKEHDPALMEFYRTASHRLLALIDDATQLMNLEKIDPDAGIPWHPLSKIREAVAARGDALEIQGASTEDDDAEAWEIRMPRHYFARAFSNAMDLAHAFAQGPLTVEFTAEEAGWRMRIALNQLAITQDECDEFFELASQVRISSSAEHLVLGPVLAATILRAFGGDLQLRRTTGNTGYLEARLH